MSMGRQEAWSKRAKGRHEGEGMNESRGIAGWMVRRTRSRDGKG